MKKVTIKRNLPLKFTILKTKLEHEIELHFEDDVYEHLTKGKNEFNLYIEITEHGSTYHIDGKYRCLAPVYRKEELECYKITGGKRIPCELKILPVNNNPNKLSLIDEMDAIIEKEKLRIEERNRDIQHGKRLKKIYDL